MSEAKTFSEICDRGKFDWNQFIDAAIESDPPPTHFEYAKFLASQWVTCACGNLCESLPRHLDPLRIGGIGEPLDESLSELGSEFYDCIRYARWVDAKKILGFIEVRASELLQQIHDATERTR